jgi:membrane associated rhomboid family serine protease
MGYQDREYYQDDRTPGGVQLGGDLSYTWRIVIINAGLFLANFFLFSGVDHGLTYYLSLHPDTAGQPLFWYQFLTYGFVHDPEALGHLFWNMFSLAMFGSMVEQYYGRREFLRFYLVSILLGGLFWGIRLCLDRVYGSLAGVPLNDLPFLLGASGGVTAVTLLFCLRYPFATINLMFVLPVPAWALGALIIISNLLQVGRVEGVAYDVHLTGVAFAIAYYYFNWNLTRVLDFSWLNWAGSALGKLVKPRPKLRVFEGDEDDDGVYRELETEADRILAKISHDGEVSLTTQERQTLERYSRLMRQKHR